MRTFQTLFSLLRADFLERVRRNSFLVTLGLMVVAGYFFVPPADARYATMNLGDYRGLYNSAWIGMMNTLLTLICLSLFGFYLVKNAIERDLRSGVGQIIATTPLHKALYLLGKMLSNVCVLMAMAGVIAIAALVMQIIRAEEAHIDLWRLWSPTLLIMLPCAFLVSGLAIFFETIPWLRGGFGNFVYFCLWTTLFYLIDVGIDVFGLMIPQASILRAARNTYSDAVLGYSLGFNFVENSILTFRWEGIDWDTTIIVERMLWASLGIGLTLLASLTFHRFDPARERVRRTPLTTFPPHQIETPSIAHMEIPIKPIRLAPIRVRTEFHRILLAELRLMLKAQRWWWYIGALVLILAGLFSLSVNAQRSALVIAWMWPLTVWSSMGVRERWYNTDQLVFATPYSLRRQLPAAWLAGVLVALLAGLGIGVALVLRGEWACLTAWGIGALFIPSLALAMGCWTGSSKAFEVIYILLWFTGPVNRVSALDFMGATQQSVANGIYVYYAAAAISLLGAAFVGRYLQINRS
jgi:hypothetical protein